MHRRCLSHSSDSVTNKQHNVSAVPAPADPPPERHINPKTFEGILVSIKHPLDKHQVSCRLFRRLLILFFSPHFFLFSFINFPGGGKSPQRLPAAAQFIQKSLFFTMTSTCEETYRLLRLEIYQTITQSRLDGSEGAVDVKCFYFTCLVPQSSVDFVSAYH